MESPNPHRLVSVQSIVSLRRLPSWEGELKDESRVDTTSQILTAQRKHLKMLGYRPLSIKK